MAINYWYSPGIPPEILTGKSSLPYVELTPDEILSIVCATTGFAMEQITGKSREAPLIKARFLAAVLLSTFCGPKNRTRMMVAKALNRDHTSIVHALETHKDLMSIRDKDTMELYIKAIKNLKEYVRSK